MGWVKTEKTNKLSKLGDIDFTNLADGQIIEYNATTQSWVNATNNIANKMDKVDPTGTGSLSLNRKANTTIGTKSVAIGNNNTASGSQSYAEGSNNVSSSINSHAEGSGNTASGIDAHAEGSGNTASGAQSHAEGYSTTATAPYSHAEGTSTQAKGDASHAEGSSTHAEGYQSHAEGNMCWALGTNSHAEGYKTRATHKGQHVCGEWNTLDPSTATSSNRGNYVEIVGNGSAENSRSNARTLDWNGNEVLAGDLTINGNQSVTQALGKIVVQKTQAEYDLLTSAEKNNGSIYKITDKAKMYCLDEEYHAIKEITSANYAQLTNTEKNNGTLYVITDEETTADDIPYSAGVSVADKLDAIPIYSEGTGIDITSNTISLDVNGLASVSSLSGTDEIAVYDGTSNKKTTVSAVAAADYTITTSTSAAGVNWTVKKYNNGDMEMWGERSSTPTKTLYFQSFGAMYALNERFGYFPETFYSTPFVIGQMKIENLSTVSSLYDIATTTLTPGIMAISSSAATVSTSTHMYVFIYARGRWKA